MTVRSIEHRTKVPEIRKGDTVVVLAGRDAGKRGAVEQVIRRDPVADGRALRLPPDVGSRVACSSSSRASTSPASTPSRASGRRVARARCRPSIRAASWNTPCRSRSSRVMVVCNHCDRPTRIAHRTLDNGTRVRVCKHCGEPLEVKS